MNFTRKQQKRGHEGSDAGNLSAAVFEVVDEMRQEDADDAEGPIQQRLQHPDADSAYQQFPS